MDCDGSVASYLPNFFSKAKAMAYFLRILAQRVTTNWAVPEFLLTFQSSESLELDLSTTKSWFGRPKLKFSRRYEIRSTNVSHN